MALKNKTIAGAALDVFEQEPTLKNHSLWGLDNIIVTPHIAGLTTEAMSVMSLECSKEIVKVKNNEVPIKWVNKKQMINI
ncbi:NAD(P)-dependent oxidoreductase [Paenisporosarcina sp. TG-14]|uniref:NAD(P)-dependent oxidoreductase n=1 Tax=Paenisporosarcina sp. TG-14 TaxID=1231057 RepID=UPI0009D9294D